MMSEVIDLDHDSPPPPNKGKRTAAGSNNVGTANGIAQVNATLQHILGGRQRFVRPTNDDQTTNVTTNADSHRYNTNTTSSHAPSQAGNELAELIERNARARAAGANIAASAPGNHVHMPSATVAQEQQPQIQEQRSMSVSQQRQIPGPPAALVRYETPAEDSMLTTANSGAITANGRKSVDIARAGPLPSPAPSDENTNSPTFAANQLNQARVRHSLQQMRNLGDTGAALTGPLSGVRPMAPSLDMQPGSPHQEQQHVRRQSNNVPSYPQPQGQPQGHPAFSPTLLSPGLPPAQFISSQLPQGQHRRQTPSNAHVPQFAPSPTVPSNLPPPPPPVPSQLQASRVNPNVLLQRLERKQNELTATAEGLSGVDNGRIYLLREAVQKGDWFYQVINQLYCLKFTNPSILPRSMRNLDPKCYAFLGTLLCDNAQVKPALVRFFADFPEPLMDIYSDPDGAREIYESRVTVVKDFLNRLPLHWDGMIKHCREVLFAPPLVQDIVDTLNIKSIVLQTVVFRAIARMIYGSSSLHAKAISAIEQVHQVDQDTYYRNGYLRNPTERNTAYAVLRQVYDHLQAHLRHSQEQNGSSPDFVAPPQVIAYFRGPTQNVLRLQQPQMSQQQILAAQHQVQQQQFRNVQSPVGTPDHNLLQQRLQQAQLQHGRASPTAISAMALQQQQLQQAQSPQHHAFHANAQGMAPPAHGGPRRFFPAKGDPSPPQPTQPDSDRAALHQANARSPALKPADAASSRLYRHVIGFGVPPTTLKKDVSLQSISVNIPAHVIEKLPKTVATVAGEPGQRNLTEGSLLYRLRCSAVPPGGFVSESAWVTADNQWPEDLKFEFNGTALELRRKLHHGRYLPIDLTGLAREGKNTLKVSRNGKLSRSKKQAYAVAVEVVGVTREDAIESKITRIPAEQSLSAIKKSLTGGDSGDDDIAVMSSALTIKLFDPYSASQIFDIPVRGASCLHRDCFDLQTFLEFCKRKEPDWPTVVDCWRCPICRGDVRPQTLVVDEFLVKVRKTLAERGQLDTRAIVVEADGAWAAKGEDRDGVRSPSLVREEQRQRQQKSASAAPPKNIEVIELD